MAEASMQGGTQIRQQINALARGGAGPRCSPSEALGGSLSPAPEGFAHEAASSFNNRKVSTHGANATSWPRWIHRLGGTPPA